jgi:hypothetical protein
VRELVPILMQVSVLAEQVHAAEPLRWQHPHSHGAAVPGC